MSFIKKPGLAFKQCLWILLSVAVIAGGSFWVIRKLALDSLKISLRERAFETVGRSVGRIDRIFSESMRVAEQLAARLENGPLTRERIDFVMGSVLGAARSGRPEILALAVACNPQFAGSPGKLMRLSRFSGDTIEMLPGGHYTGKSWYLEPLRMGRGVWCEPFIGDFVTEPIAIYSRPFYRKDASGHRVPAGVVCIDLSVAWLRDYVEKLDIAGSGYAFVLSDSGRIVAHRRREWVFKKTIEQVAAENNDAELAQLSTSIRSGKPIFVPYPSRTAGAAWICGLPLDSSGWQLGVIFPEREFFSLAVQLQKALLVCGVCGFLLLLTVVLFISSRVSRPLKKLAQTARRIGQGEFTVDIPETDRGDELGDFARAFSQMRNSLVDHMRNLASVTAAKEKIESELSVAQQIQRGILPEILPPFPKCDNFEIAAFLTPAREVGGDLYDFFMLSGQKVLLAVGDVSGKGIPASLFMAVTQTLHRGLARQCTGSPARLTTQMNEALCRHNDAMMFVTYVVGELDCATGCFTYCNAGHNPFALLRAGGGVEFPARKHGIPLGVRAGRRYGEDTLKLNAGDQLVFYTDGVTEARNSAGEFFGIDRLREVLEREHAIHASPDEISCELKSALAVFAGGAEQSDDITVLALRVSGAALQNGSGVTQRIKS